MNSTTRRRIWGIIFLGGALAMLILGLTVLERRLSPLPLLIYWLVCFALTCGAMIVAVRDLRDIRHETTDKHRDLLKDIAHEIEEDAKRKKEHK